MLVGPKAAASIAESADDCDARVTEEATAPCWTAQGAQRVGAEAVQCWCGGVAAVLVATRRC